MNSPVKFPFESRTAIPNNSESLKEKKLSPEQELVNDLISIIHVFSCRIYGLRKYKNKILNNKDIKQKT